MVSMLSYCLVALATLTGFAHSTQDLAQLRGHLRAAADADAKLEVLEGIAALQVDEISDRAITEAVVEALQDESRSVGARAAELLGAGLNTDIALDGLVEAASRLQGEEARFLEEERASAENLDIPGEDTGVRLKRLSDRFRDAARRMQEHHAYKNALTAALLLRRDDRCATGLGYLLVARLHHAEALPIVDGLLSLGTAPAVTSVMDVFELHDRDARSKRRQRTKIARQALRKQPGYWKGSTGEWKDKERARIAAALKAFDMETESRERWLRKVTKSLRAFASEQELPEAPRTSKRVQWKSWWREAQSTLPTSLSGD